MMLSMTVRCNCCGNFIYRGTKFNCRKENVFGGNYLGCIKVFRFYFRCSNCSAELVIKTDPQNSNYVVESGATGNFEPWSTAEVEEEDKEKNAEELAMKKTLENRKETANLAALHEIKLINSRHEFPKFVNELVTLLSYKDELPEKIRILCMLSFDALCQDQSRQAPANCIDCHGI
ncbi:hypothetical protein Dsin_023410 [Dipteronia sinensis]|uniref:Splicing factor YJU2 n=1 Tax=Dipteronia sinensis TaxID=43782 RepID=A0AAE0A3A4_9ROSI|nr:hypothetical protein Dsin_023410 [Dipteronia sinensis]